MQVQAQQVQQVQLLWVLVQQLVLVLVLVQVLVQERQL